MGFQHAVSNFGNSEKIYNKSITIPYFKEHYMQEYRLICVRLCERLKMRLFIIDKKVAARIALKK